MSKSDFHNDPVLQVLHQAMSAAYEEFEEARLRDERAFADMGSTPNSEGIVALQNAGRDYADAIVRHSNAVMAWLAFIDRTMNRYGGAGR